MEHKFNPGNKKRLSDEFRKKILPAHRILKEAGLKEEMTFADVGCGNGYFTFPAVKIVGSKGRVLALDISSEMLEDIIDQVKKEKIKNIEVIETEENDLKTGKDSADLAFSCNVMHETKDPELFLAEVKKILKNKGRIVIIDWEKADSDFGPPKEHRLDKIEIIRFLKNMGFKYIKAKSISKDLYRITAIKK
ncbi:MAG: class I SAM-dependent methyltransferase [Candidatus Humimicrobiaceae bacterium]